jgi:hypothetical protein
MITERGLARLQMRSYRVFRDGGRALAAMPPQAMPTALRFDVCRSERVARLRQVLHQALREYLGKPCALPDCPCIIHKHGVPQADEVTELLSRNPSSQPYNRARRRWYVAESR